MPLSVEKWSIIPRKRSCLTLYDLTYDEEEVKFFAFCSLLFTRCSLLFTPCSLLFACSTFHFTHCSLFVTLCSLLVTETVVQREETLMQVFSCEFCKKFKNTFFNRAPPAAASVVTFCSLLLTFCWLLNNMFWRFFLNRCKQKDSVY